MSNLVSRLCLRTCLQRDNGREKGETARAWQGGKTDLEMSRAIVRRALTDIVLYSCGVKSNKLPKLAVTARA